MHHYSLALKTFGSLLFPVIRSPVSPAYFTQMRRCDVWRCQMDTVCKAWHIVLPFPSLRIRAVCFSHKKDDRPCLTCRHIFGPIISKCLALPDDVSTLFGIGSTLNYDAPQARLLYLPLQSAVCSNPASAFIYSAFLRPVACPPLYQHCSLS